MCVVEPLLRLLAEAHRPPLALLLTDHLFRMNVFIHIYILHCNEETGLVIGLCERMHMYTCTCTCAS